MNSLSHKPKRIHLLYQETYNCSTFSLLFWATSPQNKRIDTAWIQVPWKQPPTILANNCNYFRTCYLKAIDGWHLFQWIICPTVKMFLPEQVAIQPWEIWGPDRWTEASGTIRSGRPQLSSWPPRALVRSCLVYIVALTHTAMPKKREWWCSHLWETFYVWTSSRAHFPFLGKAGISS